MPDRKPWPLLPGLATPQQPHRKQSEQIYFSQLGHVPTAALKQWSLCLRFAYLPCHNGRFLAKSRKFMPLLIFLDNN
jgi:hypothetical protein